MYAIIRVIYDFYFKLQTNNLLENGIISRAERYYQTKTEIYCQLGFFFPMRSKAKNHFKRQSRLKKSNKNLEYKEKFVLILIAVIKLGIFSLNTQESISEFNFNCVIKDSRIFLLYFLIRFLFFCRILKRFLSTR